MCTTMVFGQNFRHSVHENTMLITATDESFSTQGKEQLANAWMGWDAWLDITDEVLRKCLTPQQIEEAKKPTNRFKFIFYIDHKGNVVRTRFIFDKGLYQVFGEEIFKKLYKACRAVKIDMSKIEGISTFGENCYAVLQGGLRKT